jgi:hypothetical protein
MPLADPGKRREYLREYMRRYRLLNPELVLKNWRNSHERTKEKRLAAAREYKKQNREKMTALQRKRHCSQLQRTPKWADLDAIAKVYEERARIEKETGIRHEVDHVIPLQGRRVSGLHVHWNLRVVTQFENRSKGNKHV